MAELARAARGQAVRSGLTLQAFLELGFRPLYLVGTFWAALSIVIWIFWPQAIAGLMQGVLWHAHEMLWAFVATIAVGFLMTAGANWTGINPLHGKPLAAACLLWVVARFAFLAPGAAPFWIATSSEMAFFLIAAAALFRAVHKAHSVRNYGIPWLLIGLGLSDALYLRAVLQGDPALLMQSLNAGMLAMAAIALLVARRVIPFFAMRAVPGLSIPMLTRSGQVQLSLCVLAVLFALAGQSLAVATALALVGGIALFQVLAWKPLAVRHKPQLWILYLGYAGLGVGLVYAGAYLAGLTLRSAIHAHIIAVGGFSVLIIGMVTRTALGHLGRPLELDRSMVASYVLMLVAVVLRLIALVPSGITLLALQAAATAWIAAFSLYLWRFAPMLVRPRAPPPSEFRGVISPRSR